MAHGCPAVQCCTIAADMLWPRGSSASWAPGTLGFNAGPRVGDQDPPGGRARRLRGTIEPPECARELAVGDTEPPPGRAAGRTVHCGAGLLQAPRNVVGEWLVDAGRGREVALAGALYAIEAGPHSVLGTLGRAIADLGDVAG